MTANTSEIGATTTVVENPAAITMKFSTFHSFMLTDAKGVAPDHLLEGQRVGSTHHGAIADELALIRAADRLGFDTCWMREHHFTDYGFLPNTMTMAAHAAALTERIRLGTAVITLPLHHPIRVAEEIALVDVLSGGRVDVGIGRGYQSVEFDAFAVPLGEARARTDEAIEVLRALWTRDRVDHHGRFWDFDGVHLQPRPGATPVSAALLRVRQRRQHHALRGEGHSVHRRLDRSHQPARRTDRPVARSRAGT